MQELEILKQILAESPYISREERLHLASEIHKLSSQILDGEISSPQGQMQLSYLNKKAAVDEIANLTVKIHHLNPSSPRLTNLHLLGKELQSDQITPDQARKKLNELMRG